MPVRARCHTRVRACRPWSPSPATTAAAPSPANPTRAPRSGDPDHLPDVRVRVGVAGAGERGEVETAADAGPAGSGGPVAGSKPAVSPPCHPPTMATPGDPFDTEDRDERRSRHARILREQDWTVRGVRGRL